MTNELIEAMARALRNADCPLGDLYDDEPEMQEQYRVGIRTALAAAESAGYRLVPAEPTQEMAEVRELRRENERLREEMQELESENQRLREALEWYADPTFPYAITQFHEPRSAVHADGGRRAREALASGDDK